MIINAVDFQQISHNCSRSALNCSSILTLNTIYYVNLELYCNNQNTEIIILHSNPATRMADRLVMIFHQLSEL